MLVTFSPILVVDKKTIRVLVSIFQLFSFGDTVEILLRHIT